MCLSQISEIMAEIECINRKITAKVKAIDEYRIKLNSANDFYNRMNKYQEEHQRAVSEYYGQVTKISKSIDADSNFGNYYKSKIDEIFKNSEIEIYELVVKHKSQTIKRIEYYENQISQEEIIIRGLKYEIEQLKIKADSIL